jgi:hypothetical protein
MKRLQKLGRVKFDSLYTKLYLSILNIFKFLDFLKKIEFSNIKNLLQSEIHKFCSISRLRQRI